MSHTTLTMLALLFSTAAIFSKHANANPQFSIDFVTQTVYGFLDFTTTIGNTVMIFSPQSAEAKPETMTLEPTTVIETKPPVVPDSVEKLLIQPSKTIVEPESSSEEKQQSPEVLKVQTVKKPISSVEVSSAVHVVEVKAPLTKKPKSSKNKTSLITPNKPSSTISSSSNVIMASKVMPVASSTSVLNEIKTNGQVLSSIVEVQSGTDIFYENDNEPALAVENNIGEPEYDFLSRQAEYAEESYRVVNLKPSTRRKSPAEKSTSPSTPHPLGLVTKLGGTIINDGITTVHETSVIGTSISGKYAQILQSTSTVLGGSRSIAVIKPSQTSALRVLKTASPKKQPKHEPDSQIETLYGSSPTASVTRTSRKPANPTGSFKNRIKNKPEAIEVVQPQVTSTQTFGRNKKNQQNRSKTLTATKSQNTENNYTRRSYQKKPSPTVVEPDNISTSLYKFKLNRQPGRWQYKTTAKPRISIRKSTQNDIGGKEDLSNIITPVYDTLERSDDGDLEQSGSLISGDVLNEHEKGDKGNRKFPIETIKVEISTPADFKDTYYEIATIKSPYTFQVGTVKNTRYITVTSTFEKSLDPEPTISPTFSGPLTENILAKSTFIDRDTNLLDSSIATLPPLYLGSDTETPSLETFTETFSTTTELLKTHILPVVRDGTNTSSLTLTQTFHVTRLVTATKTLPPSDVYQFIPSKRLNEFNSRLDEAGSEVHLELEYGDSDDEGDEDVGVIQKELPSDLDLSNIGSDFDLSEIDQARGPDATPKPKKKLQQQKQNPENPLLAKSAISQEQLQQQIALLRLLNPAGAPQLPNLLASSQPVFKIETVYDTHILPIINGQSTTFSTLSRPIGTVTKTEYEMVTSISPLPIPPPLPQVNPLFPQPQFHIQSTPFVTQTLLTQTNSKVLKLTFGAKTALTTLFSTTVVPSQITTYITQSLPIQPTAAFPGYFPAPYGPYPYVG